MTVLRATGPDFLAERFMAESPLVHCARVGTARAPDGAEWPAVTASVSVAAWTDWEARLRDAEAFLGAARGELERLRSRYAATQLVLDVPVNRRLGSGTQEHAFPSSLLRALGELGIELRITYHPPDFAGAGERHPRIVLHPDVLGGRPTIRGTKVLVRNLVDALARGQSQSEIRQDFPDIGPEDVAAAVAFIAEQAEHA